MFETLNQSALEALVDSLETMAFLSPIPIEDPQTPPSDPLLLSMRFTDDETGVVEMVASRELGKLAACNMLGSDPGSSAQYEDALKELLNTFSGLLLRRQSCGLKQSTEMSLPRSHPFDVADWSKFITSPHAVVVDVEGSLVATRVLADRRKRERP